MTLHYHQVQTPKTFLPSDAFSAIISQFRMGLQKGVQYELVNTDKKKLKLKYSQLMQFQNINLSF